jgi:integrase
MIVTRIYNKLAEWREDRFQCGIDLSRVAWPQKNPGSLVPKVSEHNFRRRVAWSKADIGKLIKISVEMRDLDMAETIEIFYLTRLRPGDIFGMTHDNVDLAHGYIHGIQHKTITTRLPSGVPYLVAITDKMAHILERRMSAISRG